MRTDPHLILGIVLFLLGSLVTWLASVFGVNFVGLIGRGLFILGWAFFAYAAGMRIAGAVKEMRGR